MKLQTFLVAIVAAALVLFGSFVPTVAKAQAQAVPDPRFDCVEHKVLVVGVWRHHHFINTCNHDVLVTVIYEGGECASLVPGACEERGLNVCYRGQDDRWISPPGERKEDIPYSSRNRRWEYIRLNPLDGAADPDDFRTMETLEDVSDWRTATRAAEGTRTLYLGGVSIEFCPEERSEARWCVEWADLDRQKQFEKENNLRGGCREYNEPNWSDAFVRNAFVRN